MAEPSPGVEDVPMSEFPMAGAVKMAEHEGVSIGEEAACKTVSTFAAGEPATDNVEGALRGPKAME